MCDVSQTPLVSLVLATLGRTSELKELLESIKRSTYQNIELIIIDQNEPGFLSCVIEPYINLIDIKHYVVDFKGLSRSRNYGYLKTKGEIVNFPDDDSFFEKNTIEKMVDLHQNQYISYQALTCKVLDPKTREPSLLKFPNKTLKVNCYNFFKTTIEFNTFWKKSALPLSKVFNESLGLGEYFSSEESSNFILDCLEKKYKFMYISELVVYHPNQKKISNEKVFSYALGFGALFYLHKSRLCIYPYFFSYFILGLTGWFLFFIQCNDKKQKYRARCQGVVKGYIEAKKRLNKK